MAKLHIEVQSHHFCVSGYDYPLFQKVVEFCKPLIEVETSVDPRRGTESSVTKVYAASVPDRSSMRFHINILGKFTDFLKQVGITPDQYETVFKPKYTPAKLKCKLKGNIKPRDYQIPIVEFVKEPEEKTRVIGIQTGKGRVWQTILGYVCQTAIGKECVISKSMTMSSDAMVNLLV